VTLGGLVRKAAMVAIGLAYMPLVLLQLAWAVLSSRGKALQWKAPAIPPEAQDPKHGTHGYVTVNGLKFHYVSAGDGPLVLCLHGFPQSWYTWRHLIARLKDTHRVVAIDMRGYGGSDKPAGFWNYQGAMLAKDVNDIVHALGYDKCILMGHDWGGVVAWLVAHIYPALVERLVVMNCPHPNAFEANMSLNQFFKSWYIFFFQLPLLPELMMSMGNYASIATGLVGKKMGVHDRTYVSKADVAMHQHQIALPGALTAGINYYRAIFMRPHLPTKTITCPTLLLWGEEDGALSKGLNQGIDRWVPNVTTRFMPGVSHWVPEEKPDEVAAAIKEFLKA